MREEVVSPGTVDAVALAISSSPPLTPAASSAAASSSHAVPVNVGINWLGGEQGSRAGSLSSAAQVPWNSDNLGNSASVSSHFSCRPWERGDLLRRLASYKPSNWFAKPQGASSLACARKGWVSIDTDKIECESCGSYLTFATSASWTSAGDDHPAEAFAEKLDSGHNITCPWRGNCCADSLAQFPPTPQSVLIGGYKDRCDGLLQFSSLPVISSSAIETMRLSRSAKIDRLLLHSQFSSAELGFKADNMPVPEISREDAFCNHNQAQKLISLCGWEPRWLPNVHDCEEHSAQSARNACSFAPNEDERHPTKFPEFSRNALSSSARRNLGMEKLIQESRCNTKSALLDCSLCGATIRVWDFKRVPRPARFGLNNIDNPDTCKMLVLTRGDSAASGINGWIAADEVEKEHIEGRDEAATNDEGKSLSNADINLDLTIGNGLQSTLSAIPAEADPLDGHLGNGGIGRDLMIGQPAGSEVGDRAASFESRGPSTRKRCLEEGGSTVDRPQDRIQQTDSIEGTLVDHNVDVIDEDAQESDSLSKRARSLNAFDPHHLSCKMGMSGAGPSHVNLGISFTRLNSFKEGSDVAIYNPTRDSARASSVVALDIICSDDQDSMESVENYPGGISDANVNSINDASDFNYSNQAQQSTFIPHAARSFAREMGGSSTIEGDEILNEVTFTGDTRDRISLGISGGSVGMGASHEAEIRGVDAQADSTIGNADMLGEVTEIVGQSVESAPGPGLMDEFVPEVVREELHSGSQNMITRSTSKADSASKIYGSVKADSIENREKMSHMLGNAHPSLSCNAMLCSGNEASRGEVTQTGKEPTTDDYLLDSDNAFGNGSGPPIGQNEYSPEGGEFDPIKYHNSYCPWVNENVASAGYNGDIESDSSGSVELCGWQLTLDALDSFISLGHIPSQMMQSESAASLCKNDHLTPSQKKLTSQSASKSRGKHFD